jgi:hypothetical protein
MMAFMKFFPIAALLAAFLLPLAASAQQAQQPLPPPPPQSAQGYGQQGSSRGYDRWMRLVSGLNLSNQQQGQIQSALGQYFQSHPTGSAPDPQGKRVLFQQIFGALNPDQQNQLRQVMQQQRVRRLQQQLQRAQQEQQGPPNAAPPH